MSDTGPSRGAQPSRLNLEQQRKRAKELLKAHRRGEPEALARAQQQLRGPSIALKLADAQHVIAREAGFESWARLKLHARQATQSRAELLESLLCAALTDDREAVHSALAIAPDLARESLHAAAALADEPAALAQLARGSAEARVARAGGLGGSPLAYLCHARYGREKEAIRSARARMARALISAGADPNECVDAPDTPGGRLSVLSAAARHVASPELVDELLAAGAVVEPPGSTAGPPAPPLVSAALGGNLLCVQRLLAAGAPEWQAREALEVAVERADANMARALLEYGCLPDHAGRWRGRSGGCLHAALALGRDVAFIELLLAGGASVQARDRDGRSPLAVAVQLNATGAAELLRARGASDAEISDVDRLLGACFAQDRARVEALLAENPELLARCARSDHQNVCRAVRRGDSAALAELLHAGFDPDALDDDGQSALHLAIQRRELRCVELLIARGARADIPSYDNVTAAELARLEPDAELRGAILARLTSVPGAPTRARAPEDAETEDAGDAPELLAARRSELAASFELALDLMSAGDVGGLRQLLDREPRLSNARSHRHHRATLLHYLGNNGTERTLAPANTAAIAQLLLERGAQADASCHMYGGGPCQTTLGLVATTDRGFYPPGVQAALIAALVQGGARVHEQDGKSRALEGAIVYGAVIALRALAEAGARAYDLSTAAALGDLPLLEARLPAAAPAERVAAFETAAAFSQLAVLERLFQSGIDLEALGAYGGTALHKAAAADAADAVSWLLAHGADRDARDRAHRGTPADWARHFGSQRALAVLTRDGG